MLTEKSFTAEAIRAVAIDLDGTTLLPDTSLGGRTTACLKGLIARGVQVIICTGRAIESARRYYSAIGAEGPMVFFNGVEVVDVPSGKVISSRLMDLEVVDYGIDLARSMDLHFQIYFPASGESPWEPLLIEKPRPEAEMYRKHTGIAPVTADLKAAIARPGVGGVIKAMFICDPSLHDEIRRKMLERFGSRIYVVRSAPTFLEIMSAGVSKGEGLKIAMERRGLKPEEVIAFGDEENDLPMFSVAGFSAAPANAKEKVREAADFVYGSNAEEGLAAFIENWR